MFADRKWLAKQLNKFIASLADNKVLLRLTFPEEWVDQAQQARLNEILSRNILAKLATDPWPRDQSVGLIKSLLQAGFDINEPIIETWSLLHAASYNNDLAAITYLLSRSDIEKEKIDRDKKTALFYAAAYADKEIVRAMISYGCSAGAAIVNGVQQMGRHNEETIERPLKEAVQARKHENINALYALTCESLEFEVRKSLDRQLIRMGIETGDVLVVRALLDCRIIFVSSDIVADEIPREITAVLQAHRAKELELLKAVRKLLPAYTTDKEVSDFVVREIEAGCNFNLIDDDGNSLLAVAANFQQLEVIAYLTIKGAYYNQGFFDAYLSPTEKAKVGKIGMRYLSNTDDATVMYLLSCSSVTKTPEGEPPLDLKRIYSDLYGLGGTDGSLAVIYLRPILEVLNNSGIRIIFDQSNEHTKRLELNSGKGTKGMCDYDNGIIYIGAKRKYNELLGTVIHEFAHQACQLMWKNHCKPFDPVNKDRSFVSTEEQRFKDKILRLIENDHQARHGILSSVFNYPEPDRTAEMIVRIPHLIAEHYFGVDGTVDEMAFDRLRSGIFIDGVDKLFEFYCDSFLPKAKEHVQNKEITSLANPTRLLQHYLSIEHPMQVVKPLRNMPESDKSSAAIIFQKNWRAKIAKELCHNMLSLVPEEVEAARGLYQRGKIRAHKAMWRDIHRTLEPILVADGFRAQLLKSREAARAVVPDGL